MSFKKLIVSNAPSVCSLLHFPRTSDSLEVTLVTHGALQVQHTCIHHQHNQDPKNCLNNSAITAFTDDMIRSITEQNRHRVRLHPRGGRKRSRLTCVSSNRGKGVLMKANDIRL